MSNVKVPEAPKPKSMLRETIDLLSCTFGIYFCFLGYGFLHENIYKTKYGPNEEKFDHSLFLVGCQSLVNGCFATLVLLVKQPKKDTSPTLSYVKMSFTYIGAMFASNFALFYVSYPTQVLAKSCKLIPVMLSKMLFGTRYSFREYLTVAFITAGIAVFMLLGPNKKKSEVVTSWFGLGLCFTSLCLDGYTGPAQDELKKAHKPDVFQLMQQLNIYAALLVACALFAVGQFFPAIAFVQTYPEVIPKIALFCALSAFGQSIILICVFRFNSLVLTFITTTRKFFTILGSVLWYGHNLNGAQWLGVGLVFAGLLMNMYHKYAAKKKMDDEQKKPAVEMTKFD